MHCITKTNENYKKKRTSRVWKRRLSSWDCKARCYVLMINTFNKYGRGRAEQKHFTSKGRVFKFFLSKTGNFKDFKEAFIVYIICQILFQLRWTGTWFNTWAVVGRNTRGAKHQLLVHSAVTTDRKTRMTNLCTAWIDYRKTYDLWGR